MQDIYNMQDKAGKSVQVNESFTFKDWSETYGYEKNGSFKNLKSLRGDFYSELITNTSNKPKTYKYLNHAVYDLNRKQIKSLTLPPLQSRVILQSK